MKQFHFTFTRSAAAATVLAGIALSSLSASAQVTPLYSGGGTLGEKVYRDVFNCYGNHSGGDTVVNLVGPPAICNTATPYRADIEILYAGVGSGNGKKAFVGHDASHFNDSGRKPDNPPIASTSDFGPYYGTGTGSGWVPGTTGPAYPKLAFTDSNDPLLSSDLTTYNTGSAAGGWGPAKQIPTLISAVAIPFQPASGVWTEKGKVPVGGGNSSLVDLSVNTLCGIFTGAISNWNDPSFKATNGNVQLGSGTITVVYRTDSAGLTFTLANALIHQCASTSYPVPLSWQIVAGNSAGTSNDLWYANVKAAGLLPSNFIGASGASGIKSTINATAGAIGYNSPDFALPIDPAGPKAANLQIWSTFGLAAKFAAPTAINATPILTGVKPPSFLASSCPVGTDVDQSPDGVCADNALNWSVVVPLPTSAKAYPVGGFDYFDLYTCYASSADVNALVDTTAGNLGVLRWYYGSTTENASLVKNSLASNGFAQIPGPWVSAIKKLLVTNKPTKLGTPKQKNTACVSVTGSGA